MGGESYVLFVIKFTIIGCKCVSQNVKLLLKTSVILQKSRFMSMSLNSSLIVSVHFKLIKQLRNT